MHNILLLIGFPSKSIHLIKFMHTHKKLQILFIGLKVKTRFINITSTPESSGLREQSKKGRGQGRSLHVEGDWVKHPKRAGLGGVEPP